MTLVGMTFIIAGLKINTQFIFMFFSVIAYVRPGWRRQRLILVTIQIVFKKRKKTASLTYNPGSPLLSQLS